jgi:hypothetical protein
VTSLKLYCESSEDGRAMTWQGTGYWVRSTGYVLRGQGVPIHILARNTLITNTM